MIYWLNHKLRRLDRSMRLNAIATIVLSIFVFAIVLLTVGTLIIADTWGAREAWGMWVVIVCLTNVVYWYWIIRRIVKARLVARGKDVNDG